MNGNHRFCGQLFYLIGPSGAGKDSLIRYARGRIADASVLFAHRYITRPADAGGENHVAVTPEEFARLRSAGAFALDWCGNGLAYGIGIEIGTWLTAGMNVVVNGSRAYLGEAIRRYPTLCPVLIEVSDQVLAERLLVRGRETPAAIDERLARNRTLSNLEHAELMVIRNDGPLADAGDALIDLITGHHGTMRRSCVAAERPATPTASTGPSSVSDRVAGEGDCSLGHSQ